MKIDEFDVFMDGVVCDCESIMKSKGLAYSGKEDKLGNFNRLGDMLDLSNKQTWAVYFVKHFDALMSYIKGGYNDSEPIKGRVLDLICYLFLFAAILEDDDEWTPVIKKGGI